ncbi:MAG: ankyrin repeat domain-containing protein [Bryobacterales bacterium]|nr:ankyrin repeat domain-containing protein [Bryobacterales bacterium]
MVKGCRRTQPRVLVLNRALLIVDSIYLLPFEVLESRGDYSKDGWTPLHLASYFGHKEIAQLLLDAGAPVLARSKNAMNNHPLHAAAAGKSRDIVAMLLSAGAEVNATQNGGWTALHAAAQDGDAEMVKLLLMNGADPELRADNGQSALDLAMGKGSQEVVDMLEARPGIQ